MTRARRCAELGIAAAMALALAACGGNEAGRETGSGPVSNIGSLDPSGDATDSHGSATAGDADQSETAWVALNSPCGVATVDTTTDTITNHNIPLPGCSVPVGISIDRDQFVWVVDRNANLAYKVDPLTLAVQLTFTSLNGPYTYSDMTGSGLNLVVNPPG